MSYLNADFGPYEWWCDNRLIFNTTGVSPCLCFGISSRSGKPIEFHIMLQSGAIYWRVPIHALYTKPVEKDVLLNKAMMWDCFSETFEVTRFDWLLNAAPIIGGNICNYIATIDWTGSIIADQAGEVGHKCAHICSDNAGTIYAMPNNRILWSAVPWTTLDASVRPVQRSREWSVESATSQLQGIELLKSYEVARQQAQQDPTLSDSETQPEPQAQDQSPTLADSPQPQ